ncbi:MAG: HAMP domain-containing protein, partial [Cyanobacteria bacterium J06632_22]
MADNATHPSAGPQPPLGTPAARQSPPNSAGQRTASRLSRRNPCFPLRTRLFMSHLVVMGVAILALAGVSRLSTPRYFVITLKQLEGRNIRIQQMRGQLMEGFEDAWARGMLWSIVLGGAAAGGISYILSRRIVRPLTHMRSITQEFAAGDLSARVP